MLLPGRRTERVEVEVDLATVVGCLIHDIRRTAGLYDHGSSYDGDYKLKLNTEEYKAQDPENDVEVGHLVAVQHITWEFPRRDNYMDRGLPSPEQLEGLNLIAALEEHIDNSRNFDAAQARAEKAEAEARLKREEQRRQKAMEREQGRQALCRFEEARAS